MVPLENTGLAQRWLPSPALFASFNSDIVDLPVDFHRLILMITSGDERAEPQKRIRQKYSPKTSPELRSGVKVPGLALLLRKLSLYISPGSEANKERVRSS